MIKEEDIYLYSDPKEVLRKAKKMLGNDIELKISTRKNKKYMIKGDFSDDEWIHFGQMGYEDYTKHKDEERRKHFKSRNHRWVNMSSISPAFLSYILLW
jgi:hypothetical protein